MFNHNVIKRSLVVGLAVGAAAFPSMAQARSDENMPAAFPSPSAQPVNVPPVQQRLGQLQSDVQKRFAAEGGWPSAAPSARPAAISPGAFQWGDAGIGAAGATVLLGAALLLGASMTRRRRRPAVG